MSLKDVEEGRWRAQSASTVEYYWNWKTGRKRSMWFAQELEQYRFDSIYEVGIFSGRNIYKIKQKFPSVRVGGLDVNERAVEFCKSKMEGQFDLSSAFDVDQVPGQWDVIFTMGTFIHLAPDLASDFAAKLISKAGKYIFHIEKVGHGEIINGPKELNPTSKKITNKIRWEPNISKIYKDLGQSDITTISLPLELRASDCMHLVSVKVNKDT